MKGAIFNVGPLTNKYAGPHTYADVLFPFVKELHKRGVELQWVGIELDNEIDNPKLQELGIEYNMFNAMDATDYMRSMMSTSWDFIKPEEYDFFLCQPRPDGNKIENFILFALIDKFLDAGVRVYVWEQDMFTDGFSDRMREEVIFLHPAEVKSGKFKNEIHFPFFTYTPTFTTTAIPPERDLDFLFMGNIYGRQEQAHQFFAPLGKAPFKKLVFGSWVADEERRAFSSQFDDFEFAGSTEHWAAIPTMQRAKATLHIVPDFARDRGLMTARVFTSLMAGTQCFVDSRVVDADKYFPKELIVDNGDQIIERWDMVQAYASDLLAQRWDLMKEHTVEKRVSQFLDIHENYGQSLG